MIYIFLLILFSTSTLFSHDKTIFLTILARNKAHTLPKFLSCITNLNYDPSLITIYINTNNNVDNTESILEEWIAKNNTRYHKIIYDKHFHKNKLYNTNPHEWNSERFTILAHIRNQSLQHAIEEGTDFYFVVDCDNFINPETLSFLIEKNVPIIAPMLNSIPEPNDYYSNFFCNIDSNGYYADDPEYYKILARHTLGTFEVPVVHCTYLIKKEYLKKLQYTDDSNDYEFIIFSRIARKNNIKQYITNEIQFGYLIHFYNNISLSEEVERTNFLDY